MKKLLLGLTFISSLSSFASTAFVEGVYVNGNADCEVELTYDGNKVRVLTASTSITPFGVWPFLSESSANEQYQQNGGVVSFETGVGMRGFKAVSVDVAFDENKEVSSFAISDNAGSEAIVCEDMSLR